MDNQSTQHLVQILAAIKQGTLSIEGLPENIREQVLNLLIIENVKKSRVDFHSYVLLMADEIISDGFKDGAHIRIICKKLMEVERSIIDTKQGKRKFPIRTQYFLPPGSMKSTLISILFASWFLGRNPNLRVLQLGASTDFAVDIFGRKVKDLIASSKKYQAIFPDCQLKADTRSAQRFELTKGGGYYAAGANAGIAGRRADLMICADVLNEQTAVSDSERGSILRWYNKGARSRLKASGAEIIVNTRWHIDDLSAYLLRIDKDSKNPWEIFSIPAILDLESAKLLGKKVGESFWEDVWPLHTLLNIKSSYLSSGDASSWSALYMQNPIPEEGNLVKKDYIKYWEAEDAPTCDLVVVSCDTAYETGKRNDYTAVTVWGVFRTRFKGHNGVTIERPNIILLKAVRGRWELPELITELHSINEEFKPDWFVIEKKASGISVIQELRRIPTFPLFEYMPDKDKTSRLHSALPVMKSGCVWFPKDYTFTEEVVNELLQFPAGKHDDYVDTVSMIINWMRTNSVLLQPGERGYTDEDEEDVPINQNISYWSQVAKRY